MGKISRTQGPSIVTTTGPQRIHRAELGTVDLPKEEKSVTDDEIDDDEIDDDEIDDDEIDEGGDSESLGNSSEASPETHEENEQSETPNLLDPAPTMDNRLSEEEEEFFTVDSTVGSGRETDQRKSSKPTKRTTKSTRRR